MPGRFSNTGSFATHIRASVWNGTLVRGHVASAMSLPGVRLWLDVTRLGYCFDACMGQLRGTCLQSFNAVSEAVRGMTLTPVHDRVSMLTHHQPRLDSFTVQRLGAAVASFKHVCITLSCVAMGTMHVRAVSQTPCKGQLCVT